MQVKFTLWQYLKANFHGNKGTQDTLQKHSGGGEYRIQNTKKKKLEPTALVVGAAEAAYQTLEPTALVVGLLK